MMTRLTPYSMIVLATILAVRTTAAIPAVVCVNGHPSVSSEYKSSQEVIASRVLTAKQLPPTNDNYFLEGTTYRVMVEKSYKGSPSRTLSVFSENSSGRFPMKIGHRYLLFLYQDRGRYQVDNCGNSDELARSSRKITELERIATGGRRR
jgi:hypothetical protein